MLAKYMVRSCGFLLFLHLFNNSAFAQRDLTDIPEPNPVAELAAMKIDPAVKVNLFASDPQIRKPIQSNFDSLGRLWVASSESYPQLAPGEKANDKILVLEDTNHDGVADKSTTFADGLLIPTGVLPDGPNAAYIAHATEILYMRDTDGDGKADQRDVVLSGFGTEDTHHLIHTLRWGPDGCMYFNQSIYIHTTVETAFGTRRLDGGGIWRYRPETGQLEVFCKGFVNPWGHVFDAFGQSLATDGAYFEGINHVFPDAVFVTSPGAPRWLAGMNPGSPKHCGLAVISGDHFPESWQGDLVTNDFRSHRVCRFTLTPQGSKYESRQQPELINSSHIAFRPIDAGIGGDGALYVSDWYNPIIQHGEVDFRDERRDRSRGRIWRISYEGRPLAVPPAYATLATGDVVALLGGSSLSIRQFARLELKSRDKDEVLSAVSAWVDQSNDRSTKELREMEAMWIDECFDVVDPARLGRLLQAEDGRVRAAAMRTVGLRRSSLDAADQWLANATVDAHPQVRLEAVAALGRGSDAKDVEVALRILDFPVDPNLDFALWNTVRTLAPLWSPKLAEGKLDYANNPNRLVFLLSAAGTPQAAEPVVQAVVSPSKTIPLSAAQARTLMVPLAGIVDANQMTRLIARLLETDSPTAFDWNEVAKVEMLRGIVAQTGRRGLIPAGIEATIVNAYTSGESADLRTALVEAAGAWKIAGMVQPMRDAFQAIAANEKDASQRETVIRAMGQIATDPAVQALLGIANDANAAPGDRAEAAVALVGPSQKSGLDSLQTLISDARTRAPMIDRLGSFFSRKGLNEKLTNIFAETKVTADDARRMIAIARASSSPDSLIETIRSAGTLQDAGWKWSDELRDRIMTLASKQGDAARGEAIYRREALQCVKCHAIGTAGGLVGPNLVSLGGGSTAEYVLRSLIDPNDKLKEGYNTVRILTLDGRVLQGIPAGGNAETIQLRTAEGQVLSIARNDIEEESNGQSLMPAGLVDSLTGDELADLLVFMTSLGRVPEYSVSTSELVRSVEFLVYNNEANRILNRTSTDAVATNDPAFVWKELTSRVNGLLPIGEMDKFQQHQGVPPTSYIRFKVTVGDDGVLDMMVSNEAAVGLWLDGKPTPLAGLKDSKLEPGEHSIVLGLNRQMIPEGVTVELK